MTASGRPKRQRDDGEYIMIRLTKAEKAKVARASKLAGQRYPATYARDELLKAVERRLRPE
jgi:hypothetical protein